MEKQTYKYALSILSPCNYSMHQGRKPTLKAAITALHVHTQKQRKRRVGSSGMVASPRPKLCSPEIPLTSKAGYRQQCSDCPNHPSVAQTQHAMSGSQDNWVHGRLYCTVNELCPGESSDETWSYRAAVQKLLLPDVALVCPRFLLMKNHLYLFKW